MKWEGERKEAKWWWGGKRKLPLSILRISSLLFTTPILHSRPLFTPYRSLLICPTAHPHTTFLKKVPFLAKATYAFSLCDAVWQETPCSQKNNLPYFFPNYIYSLLYIIYCSHFYLWPPLWSSGQSSWLQSQRSGFDSQRYQIFWELVSLERGPLSLVSTTEELLERERSGSGLESREYCRMDPSRWPRVTLYPQKLALTSPTSGGGLVGIVRSRTEATEFFSYVGSKYYLKIKLKLCFMNWNFH
jgi:hypothetical protein